MSFRVIFGVPLHKNQTPFEPIKWRKNKQLLRYFVLSLFHRDTVWSKGRYLVPSLFADEHGQNISLPQSDIRRLEASSDFPILCKLLKDFYEWGEFISRFWGLFYLILPYSAFSGSQKIHYFIYYIFFLNISFALYLLVVEECKTYPLNSGQRRMSLAPQPWKPRPLKSIDMAEELKQVADLITANTIFCTKEVLTSDEAAKYMGVSKSYLYKLTMRQQIPHYKPMGKMCYFT